MIVTLLMLFDNQSEVCIQKPTISTRKELNS